MWALGAAVMALFGGMRREMPARAASPPPMPPTAGSTPGASSFAPLPMTTLAQTSSATDSQDAGAAALTAESSAQVAVPASAPLTPALSGVPPLALSLPRASFWERMGAAFLDTVLVSLLGGLVGGPPLFFLVALAYFAGMWAWKGTTVGGVVLKLKVVRLDGQPVTFPVALVRCLAAAFSVIVFFLGFLWIAWDPDKQGWHDKIAGTVVVRLPQTQSLVCF
jgi:uncharacterized RDD family membrane protein YckC